MKKLLLLLTTIAACGGPAMGETPIAIAAAAPAALTAPAPSATNLTPVFIETGSPHSDCVMSTGAGAPVHVVTDHNGLIRLHVSGADDSFAPNVTFSCTDATGKATKGATSPGVAADQPRLRALYETIPADARALPALHGDLSRISDDSLLVRGYPPRPDPSAKDAYAAWVQFVSKDNTFIPPHSVRGSGYHGQQSYTNHWSGLQLWAPSDNSNPYKSVFGYWNIPHAFPVNGIYQSFNQSDIIPSSSVQWVGLGGPYTQSLVQSGTDINTGAIRNWSTQLWSFYVVTSVWNEWFPGPFDTISMTVSQGDSMQVHSWVGDDVGHLNVSGHFGWTYLIDNTRNTATSYKDQSPTGPSWPTGIPFDGTNAEWIVETTGNLANYGTMVMPSTAFAQANNGSIHQWQTEAPDNITSIDMITPSGAVRNWAWVGDANDTPSPFSLHFQWQTW